MSQLLLDLVAVENFLSLPDTYDFLNQLCTNLHLHVLNTYNYQFQPQGMTVVFTLAESHLSLHTFPERKALAFDLYTCRSGTEKLLLAAADMIETRFKGKTLRKMVITRMSL